jgi:hypothetical protein
MAARSRATSSGGRGSRGDTGLREAINNVVRALPLGSLAQRLASVESAVSRLEREARRVLSGARGRGGTAAASARRRSAKKATGAKRTTTARRGAGGASAAKKTSTAKRAASKRATPKKATTKRTTPTRATTKKATPKRATTKRATPKRATTKRATRGLGGGASGQVVSPTRVGALGALPPPETGEGLGGRGDALIAELDRALEGGRESVESLPDDDDLASEELSAASNMPPGPGSML